MPIMIEHIYTSWAKAKYQSGYESTKRCCYNNPLSVSTVSKGVYVVRMLYIEVFYKTIIYLAKCIFIQMD